MISKIDFDTLTFQRQITATNTDGTIKVLANLSATLSSVGGRYTSNFNYTIEEPDIVKANIDEVTKQVDIFKADVNTKATSIGCIAL